MKEYFGEYTRFETVSKKDASQLLGGDNMIGDVYDLNCSLENGEHRAWLINRFDQKIGFLSPALSKTITTLQAQGLTTKAILSFIAFTDHPDEGHYWGEVALVCFDPVYSEAFNCFISNVSKRMGDNVRSKVDLGQEGAKQVIQSHGEWFPKQTVPMPKNTKGTAVVKCRRSVTDKLIEQGRAGNKGCYVISWIFLLALVTLIVFFAFSCSTSG